MTLGLLSSARHPVRSGFFLGFVLPLSVVAPAVLWGGFERLQAGGNAYFLMPIMAFLALPAGFAGFLFQRHGHDRRALWRFCAGLLLGGSAAGTLLLYSSSGDISLERRLIFSSFGGVMLSGFWLWLGGFIGGYASLEKDRAGNRLDDPTAWEDPT